MKKKIAIISVIMALGMLTACGGDKNSSKDSSKADSTTAAATTVADTTAEATSAE
ncbi:MAG: hypothetical protein GX346_01575 [Clostridiales bacterium]|nr:hypothetical protein [Clostridiales bacterium]